MFRLITPADCQKTLGVVSTIWAAAREHLRDELEPIVDQQANIISFLAGEEFVLSVEAF
jgi:hypothetical protein